MQKEDLKKQIKNYKLRCKDINIKRSHPISSKKGKGSEYKREKNKWEDEV